MEGQVRIGTCGWSYPTGRGTWNGLFYPPPGSRGPRRFDELAYYAEHFDTVEVNSTFYRPPSTATARSWATRTPPGFEFAVKLYQGFTHPAMAHGRPPGARGETDPVPEVTDADARAFLEGIDPLAQAGKLGPLLVQFPPSFRQTPHTLEYLEWLLTTFAGHALAIELRDRSWSDGLPATLSLLNAHGAAWAQIDEPKFRFSIRQNRVPNVTGFYYLRLHGRNAKEWWAHDESEDRYNYLYTPAELDPFAETVEAVRTIVRKAYVYMNNHFAAKAVVNAVELKHQLGQPITGEYRAELFDAYPQLAAIPGCHPEPILPLDSGGEEEG